MSGVSRPRVVETDVLVLGSGMAGLTFAIRTASHGEVVVLTKKEDSDSNTNYAQGGIAAVMDPADSYAAHRADTLAAGAGLCHEAAVELLVERGPDAVRRLIELGVQFSYAEDGTLSLAREGGHSARRIVRADDLTGRAIERGLLAAAADAGVTIHEHLFALDLWTVDAPGGRRCVGALAVDRISGEVVAFRARVVFLATGGGGQVYRYTTNPPIATGDGMAMAYRAGAAVANMEFVQFHPTGLWPVERDPFLVSEAVRGEGAVLRDHEGRSFMEAYDPAGDLAPRDVVARAIDAEMRRAHAEHVWLDCSSIDPDRFAERFPNILETCRGRGWNPPAEPLPVVPAAHYFCGGVRTDLDGRTDVEGLLAAGEVACVGVHGANRLASNSLLEAVVFAERAAGTAKMELESAPARSRAEPPTRRATGPRDAAALAEIREEIGRTMWKGAGIVRDDEGLEEAVARLRGVRADVPVEPVEPAAAEVANLHRVASLVVRSAILRKESRGLHFTRSHPDPDPAYRRDTVLIPSNPQETP
ncbi:MAG: L-aspartate oxidase [Gemmatimonadota bacterium]|nr:L-aspartate oxidase [Gemmatimonadota bacterium]